MAIQVINDPYRSFGASIGAAFGGGLANSLTELAEQKIHDLAQRNMQSRLAKSLEGLNFSPEEAQFIAALPEDLRGHVINNYWQRSQGMPQQLQNTPEEYAQQQQKFAQEQFYGMPQDQLQQQQGPASMQQILQLLAGRGLPQESRSLLQNLPGNKEASMAAMMQPVAPKKQMPMAQPQVQGDPLQKRLTVAEVLRQPPLREQREQRKLEIAEEKLRMAQKAEENKEKREAFKETKELRKDITQRARLARQDIRDLERMEELSNLDTPGYVEFLKNSGLDIPSLMEADSQEFQKIAMNFMRGAKEYFGGRVSNYEIENFLKTIPSLSQSPEGRKRVIANLKYMKQADLAYNEALKEVVAENKGIPPFDLAERVDDKIEKKLDRLEERFRKDLAKPVPKGQNKLITALQSMAGEVVSAAPGAAAGALAGSFVPGIGTAAGAALGALGGKYLTKAVKSAL